MGGVTSKICTNCESHYADVQTPTYLRCQQSEAPEGSDGTLCGVMRAAGGLCGTLTALSTNRKATDGRLS